VPDRIDLPACLLDAYKLLFPKLNFGKLTFFRGTPWYLPRAMTGFAFPASLGIGTVNVYVREDMYEPCSKKTFLLIAHELVHALQFQQSGPGVGLFNLGLANYMACALATGSFLGDRDHPAEREAYDYADGTAPIGSLRACIEAPSPILPCDRSGILSPLPNAAFSTTLMSRCPSITKSFATETFGSRMGQTSGTGAAIGVALGPGVGFFLDGLGGALIGVAVGATLGALRGFTSLVIGLATSLALGIVGGIVQFPAAVIEAIAASRRPTSGRRG